MRGNFGYSSHRWICRWLVGILMFCSAWMAHALPAFANQTGQSCLACHAGGQYPELTPYGRLFKLTGYTIGDKKALPLSVMGVAGASHMRNVDAVNNQSTLNTPINNNKLNFETGSLFFAGKVSDNVGAFVQVTYDNFAAADGANNNVVGHTAADTMDFRWADQIVSPTRDLIYGLSLNNNPSISDPWNTSWTWMNYVPATAGKGANAYIDATSPYPNSGLPGGHYGGLTAYAFLNKTYYAELGLYRTPNGAFSFMNSGNMDPIQNASLTGTNPYWRLAYNKEWNASNVMVGLSGMSAHPYDFNNGVSLADPASYQSVKVQGIDSQYQYLLDPHTITVQGAYQHQVTLPSLVDTAGAGYLNANIFRLKASYIYMAKYGASAAYFNQNGDFTSATQGNTFEVFYIPIQNVRVGLQYTAYNKLANITTPSDANSLRLYVWAAY
jgi:hypothetical protein